jgi:hypothetical protein
MNKVMVSTDYPNGLNLNLIVALNPYDAYQDLFIANYSDN